VRTRIFPDPEALGDHLAERLLREIAQAERRGRRFLLGCPTGRSPLPTYRAMARRLQARPQSLVHLVLVMMDEYLVETPEGLAYAPDEAHFSCRGFCEREMRAPWNAVLAPELRLPAENAWFPDPASPENFDDRIRAAGGVDFFILASGASDGHVAFNPASTPREAGTRVMRIAEDTRRDNLATFPAFRSLDEVPRWGVTAGVATIAGAKAAAMILTGAGKREAFRRIGAAEAYAPGWPATVIAEIREAELLADAAAADLEARAAMPGD
jgi:glucosamine-6-phosphate deaminase